MKNLNQILGDTQLLLGISFDPEVLFEERLTQEHRGFLVVLRVTEDYLPLRGKPYCGMGRPACEDIPIFRAFLAKSYYRLETTEDLRSRLASDANLRRICGFRTIPSPATFSRRLKRFAHLHLPEACLAALIKDAYKDRLVHHVSRDSTAIEAREKAKNKRSEVKMKTPAKRKRGRPRKDEKRQAKAEKRLTKQLRWKPGKSLSELEKSCAWGCKRNSQGNPQYWKGYKLHLDVSESGIPLTACLTSANVHDSQAALPLEKLTERRVTHLYTLADSAYDAPQISGYIRDKGRVAVIERNKRRSVEVPALDPVRKNQMKGRTVAERANSHLKGRFLPNKLYVKGYLKVNFTLLMGVFCLAAVKILQAFFLPQGLSS